ncbi:MAG: hypothetical protein NVSMB12_12260 [Acidimicrobiales bacterium]
MGILLAFAVGYVVGARAGAQDFDDVVRAVEELRHSEEVRDLWAVLRTHAAHTLRTTADMLESGRTPGADVATDLVDRVRLLMRRD